MGRIRLGTKGRVTTGAAALVVAAGLVFAFAGMPGTGGLLGAVHSGGAAAAGVRTGWGSSKMGNGRSAKL